MASYTADEMNLVSDYKNWRRELHFGSDGVRIGQRLCSFSQKSSLNTILDFADDLFDDNIAKETISIHDVDKREEPHSIHRPWNVQYYIRFESPPPLVVPCKSGLLSLASKTNPVCVWNPPPRKDQDLCQWTYPTFFSWGSFISTVVNTLLVWHCQSSDSSLEFVTYIDMMHIMMFITVIHLASGDIEINPGPQDLLKKKPKVRDLRRIFTHCGVDHDYITIGVELDVQWRDLNINNPALTGTNLCLVFDRWIQKNKDVTWERILRLCQDCQYGRVESEIYVFLSSDKAHTEYGMEPDFECSENMMIPKSSNDNKYSNKTVCRLLIIIIVLLLIIIIVLCYLVARPNQPTVITLGNGLASKTMINECQTLIDCNELDKLCV